ncbi:hypothetical protein FNT36_05975 [Hymenobacter setariae]|uniref:DUF4249 family protein n=1 Tax=Hymenobacter setariae TaxID=2594794 RepID=A0A558C4E5_9BACT|nr:hypothetical protein [Hymenobacter setariae]TVT43630.1 hypothetical protein FNT36_05975 [Hymenobacter setariae]
MKKILCSIPGLLIMLALAGCCANDICVCQDELADALFFTFRIGGTNGFRADQIDTLFIVRIPHPTALVPKPTRDSILRILPLANGGATLTQDSLIAINNAAPFAASGGLKLDAYDYQITAYQYSKAAPVGGRYRYTFKISNIKLDGQYQANGCCTCYSNTGKQFDLSSNLSAAPAQPKVVTAPVNKPIITPLTTR